jgi:hypothetical protein
MKALLMVCFFLFFSLFNHDFLTHGLNIIKYDDDSEYWTVKDFEGITMTLPRRYLEGLRENHLPTVW